MLRYAARFIFTGGAAILIGVALWVASVSMFARLFRPTRGDTVLWTVTLWLCLGSATFLISSRQWAASPRLACTIACALFVVLYRIGEGPIGGNVSATAWAYANLVAITLAVFVVSDLGVRFRKRQTAA